MKLWRLLPLGLCLLLLSGCSEDASALNPVGEIAKMQGQLMILSIVIMTVVLVVVFILFAYVLIRFRKRPGQDEIPEQVEGNHKLEIIWTVIPIVLLLILAVPTVMQVFALENNEGKEDAIKVQVTAHQYWWEIEYPELGVVTASDLYIPTNKWVNVELDSADVIHAFWVPGLAGKQDTNPGQRNKTDVWLKTEKEEIYYGQCAELCGPSHALMDFKVKAVSQAEFDQWVENIKEKPEAPQTDVTQLGQKVYQQNCLQCHAIGGEGGNIGPNLTAFGDRLTLAGIMENNKDHLVSWIKDPNKFKPVSEMPGFQEELTNKQINAVAKYLLSLKLEE